MLAIPILLINFRTIFTDVFMLLEIIDASYLMKGCDFVSYKKTADSDFILLRCWGSLNHFKLVREYYNNNRGASVSHLKCE